jgi:hypothetical protein
MAFTPQNMLPFIGLVAWGDLGKLTLYRDHRGATISFAKTFPQKPPTPAQLHVRHRLSVHAAEWRTLAYSARQALKDYLRRARARASPYNLYQHIRWKQGDSIPYSVFFYTKQPITPLTTPVQARETPYRPKRGMRWGMIPHALHVGAANAVLPAYARSPLVIFAWNYYLPAGTWGDCDIISDFHGVLFAGVIANLRPLACMYPGAEDEGQDWLSVYVTWPDGRRDYTRKYIVLRP